ncbi:hypothetical protein L226DRAFT_573994 [Lentinus tigrinus ALCF2SS1-7]|uniref:Uncharacterized protein n=1 Tax=Lentinus tigrinus ALCF2SS1-6 TaxID=1328759 RepID=A0A5C2RZD2_9APHY|nr:hypothetical protein L227DRAFT_256606 [Lentinus tigrinus ALCF2SS1-6]RPD71526.1 hypothetical protein L226DRAFT_573994 [Lentinus tigrinus ALCF2SS1-7]
MPYFTEPASAPKYPPASMKHWTAGLVTESGEVLPSYVVAYALGCVVPSRWTNSIPSRKRYVHANCSRITQTTLWRRCSSMYLIQSDAKQTLLRARDPDTGKPLIVWVHAVVPGTSVTKPTERISPEEWATFDAFLSRKGISEEMRKNTRRCRIEWPKGSAYPVWVPQALLDHMRKWWRQFEPKKRAVEEASKSNERSDSASAA